jgi:hypothetical protein
LRNWPTIPLILRIVRLGRAIALICFSLSVAAPVSRAQDHYSIRPNWTPRGNTADVFELYQRELFRARSLQPLFYLVNQAESPPQPTEQPIEEPLEAQAFDENGDLMDTAPPGAMLFDGVRHWFANTPFFGHGVDDVRDPRRHWGVGVPLEGTSWRNRPWHFGMFVGMVDGGEVADGAVLQDSGLFWGVRLGNDFDHYWGWELRAGMAHVDLNRTDTGAPLAQDGRNTYYDLNLLYYPLGDTRWRPYISLGIGASTHGFADLQGNSFDETTAAVPIALGVKYFVRPGYTLRADFTNNISFGTGNAAGTDNVSLSIGFDLHFGGRRKVYYPYDSSVQVW